ncbi:MAG: hypothetical protein AAGE52_37760 [Myxococcota bacterium]
MSLAEDQIPDEVREVCARLRERGHRAWIVGGCVRDLLLGREVNDWDICTSAKPKETKAAFRKVIPTGIQHGTVTVLWKGVPYEVTTLRGEGAYSDGRRPDEVFFVDDIADDLARRDFTVNAIAYEPTSGTLVDPFGGAEDLAARRIRAVGVPAERFAEDGLRILRGARFVGTLEFTLEDETEAAFAGALDTFEKVSHERIREEWLKAMKAPRPSPAFEVMRRTGILDRSCPLLPPLADWPVGDRNAWEVCLRALDDLQGPPEERLAALLHGVGRPRATDETYPGASADLLEKWLTDYRFSKDERRTITHLVRHQRVDPSVDERGVRRFLQRAEKARAPAVLRVRRAIVRAEGGDENALAGFQEEVEKALALNVPTTVGDLAVKGHDVQAALGRGGRAIGEILRTLLDEVLDNPSLNERETLLARIAALAPEHQ